MDVLGGVSSVIAVCSLLKTCMKCLRRLYNTFKFAQMEVQQLMDEVNICQSFCVVFNHIARPLESRVMKVAKKEKLEEKLQAQANSAGEQINRIMAKFRPLMNCTTPSSFDQLLAKFRWYYTKHESQALMVTFSILKHSLILLVDFLTLENTLMTWSQPSMASQDRDLLLSQIKDLKRMIRRQNTSLNKMIKTMNNLNQNVYESSWISNTESMVIIIKQIGKEPITEARAVIHREMQDHSPVPIQTQRVHDPTSSRTSPAIGLSNAKILSASRLASTIASPDSQKASYRAVKNISRGCQTTRHTVVRDYRDGNRERYELGSSSSFNRDDNGPHKLFVPMPPFDVDDWHARDKRKGGSENTN